MHCYVASMISNKTAFSSVNPLI